MMGFKDVETMTTVFPLVLLWLSHQVTIQWLHSSSHLVSSRLAGRQELNARTSTHPMPLYSVRSPAMPAPFQGFGEKIGSAWPIHKQTCGTVLVIHSLVCCKTEAENMGNQTRPCYRFDHIASTTSPTKILRLLLLSGSHAGGSHAQLNKTCFLEFG